MIDIIDNVSKLTTIPKDYLDKLIQKVIWCICDAIYESILNKQDVTEMDIGIGTLYILNNDKGIKFKYIPNKQVEEAVKDTIVDQENPVQLILEKRLVSKIVNTYKDIL